MRLLSTINCSMWGQAFSLPPGFCPARARPREILRSRYQPGFHGIILDVSLDLPKLSPIPHQMILTFILPKRPVAPMKNPVRLMSGVPFKRSQPHRRIRTDQHMHVIRHDHERVQIVTVEPLLTIIKCLEDHCRDLSPPQEDRTDSCNIQEPIHSNKGFTRSQSCRWKDAVLRKAPMQTKSHEERLTHDVPMRKPPFIAPHDNWCQDRGFPLTILEEAPGRSPAAAQKGCPTRTEFKTKLLMI